MASESHIERIILFDGICGLCNSTVDFILRHDTHDQFKFASLQSDVAKKLLNKVRQTSDRMDSLVLIEANGIYFKSTAVLKIARELNWPFKIIFVFILIPGPIRDSLYTFVAKYRYAWFGRLNTCRRPDPKYLEKFLI